MPKSKDRPNHRDNRQQQPPATVHLPSTDAQRTTASSHRDSTMYVRRSTLKFDEDEEEEEVVMMWNDDLPHTDAFTSELVPYGIKQSNFEPDNVHFKQSFNQRDLLNEKIDAWTNLAEEAKRQMKRKDEIKTDTDMEEEKDDIVVDMEAETNVTLATEAIDTMSNVAITNKADTNDPNGYADTLPCSCCTCFKYKPTGGVECCRIQTGIPLPCFIVVVVFAILLFPVTLSIAFTAFVIRWPVVKFAEARKNTWQSNKESQSGD